jgi:hypothetical protein
MLPMAAPSFAGRASAMRWPTMPRSTRRATGTTTPGSTGATTPPTRTAPRMYQGRNAGTCAARRERLRAATLRSSGRTTRSTKPMVKARPDSSLSTCASRWAESVLGADEASCAQRRARATASSPIDSGRAAAGLAGWSMVVMRSR